MIKGINEQEEKIIKEILSKYPYDFYYYGSRVKGDFTKGSDLDILIETDNKIPNHTLEQLSLEFNKSRIPYIVNFTDINRISKDFYKLIENSLIKV